MLGAPYAVPLTLNSCLMPKQSRMQIALASSEGFPAPRLRFFYEVADLTALRLLNRAAIAELARPQLAQT
jgi:hypothetical protein